MTSWAELNNISLKTSQQNNKKYVSLLSVRWFYEFTHCSHLPYDVDVSDSGNTHAVNFVVFRRIVPKFTISDHGSSCKSLSFFASISILFLLNILFAIPSCLGLSIN